MVQLLSFFRDLEGKDSAVLSDSEPVRDGTEQNKDGVVAEPTAELDNVFRRCTRSQGSVPAQPNVQTHVLEYTSHNL